VDESVVLLESTSARLPTGGRGSGHIVRLHICALDFQTEPPVDCPDDDSGDATFVKAASAIGGRDAVEEYVACGMHLLSAGVSFRRITDGVTLVLRVRLPLPKFRAMRRDGEDDIQVLVEAESVIGSYSHSEHDVCVEIVSNEGRLNCVFELVGVVYGPSPCLALRPTLSLQRKGKLMLLAKGLANARRHQGRKKLSH
jgi:hypothetical protein